MLPWRPAATLPAPPWAASPGGWLPDPSANCGAGGRPPWPFPCWPPLAAVLFLLLVPKARGFTPAKAAGLRGACETLAGHVRNRRLLALYVQAFLMMGGFVAVYNYLGFRLAAAPFALPATLISLIFLAYLSGTFSSRWAAALTLRFGRRNVLLAGCILMVAGLALTLTQLLALILLGLVVFTGGFFAAHSIGAGWTGSIASTGRAQAASLYNLSYYLGSSVIGWAGGLVFQSWGWPALAVTVMVLACLTAVTVAVAHPWRETRASRRARRPGGRKLPPRRSELSAAHGLIFWRLFGQKGRDGGERPE